MSDSDSVEGVDYAFPPIPSVASLKAAGKVFVCRYGGPGSADKQLTAGERDALHAAGIAIVANAEGAADGLKGGRAAGVAWAQSALKFWNQLGLPADRPIYFSVDFDASSRDWAALDAAFDGIASVIGRARTGVYGEYAVMEHLASNRKAVWFWQTYGWSSGQWSSHNHIEQYKNGVRIGGADCDLNRAMSADYGQWTGDDDMSWDEKVGGTVNPNRTFRQVMQDLSNQRDWEYATDGGKTVNPPGPDSRAQQLVESAQRAPVAADVAAFKAALMDPEMRAYLKQIVEEVVDNTKFSRAGS